MSKSGKHYVWINVLSWVFWIVVIVVAGRHLLLYRNFDYVTTLEWVVIGVSVIGEFLLTILKRTMKNKEQ